MIDSIRQYPPWEHAASTFLLAGFQPGDVIPHEWFWTAFGLQQPTGSMALADAEPLKLRHLTCMDRLRSILLESNQIALEAKPGIGYRWIVPAQQTRTARDDFQHDIRRITRNFARTLVNVNHDALTDEQRKENMDELARLAKIKAMQREARKWSIGTDEPNRLPASEPKADTA